VNKVSRIGSFGNIGRVALAVGALSAVWMGCSAKKQTELVPGVISQIQVPRTMKTIRVDVAPEGQKSGCFFRNVDPATGGVALPRTLGVLPNDPTRLVTITIAGYPFTGDEANAPASMNDCAISPFDPNAGGAKILRRTRQRYVDGKIMFIPMPLRYSCWEKTDCKEDESCAAGRCVPAAIDPNTLVEFNDNLVDGKANTCFSPKTCLQDQLPAKLVDAGTCDYTFAITPPGPGVNVRVLYDNAEAEILDLDKNEGFFVPDPMFPQRIRLAPGVCDLVKAGLSSASGRKILGVTIASICQSKTVLQPICDEEQAAIQTHLPDGGTSTDGGCNISNELVPAPSALYVLMDQSKSMDPIFGSAGLSTVLGFSLNDPVFRKTSLGFKLLPHQAADCATSTTPNSVGDASLLDVKFGLAPTVQPAVASLIGDKTKVLATDQPLLIDAALQVNGAYRALRDFKGNSAFNRTAVLLIVNRTVATDCGGTHPTPSAEALAAFNTPNAGDRIFTYVVLLGNGTASPDDTEARAVATNGGTQIFDARSNAAEGAVAFNTVVNYLGSCLYEKPAYIDPAAAVSYTDPLTSQSTTVAFNGACNEANAATIDGWNLDAGRVRICGKACGDLRTVLTNATNFAQLNSLPPPSIPVLATQLCK
jgi:hypothetical protein